MPSRYEASNIIPNSRKVESDGSVKQVRRLSSILYPNFDTVEDTRIISQEGDRLDLLAKEYYGDETFWFVIARSNNLGKGTMVIPPGTIVRIPYYTDYTGIDSLLYDYNREYR
jgi:nucleoid-associated protein YgaU